MSAPTTGRPQALPLRFELPPGSEATEPPEQRGLRRDEVRLLVAGPDRLEHRRFHELPDLLAPGDLLVVNTSPTEPAALDARVDGRLVPLHVAGELDDGRWVVEPRRADGQGPDRTVAGGSVLDLPGGVRLRLGPAYPRDHEGARRLWTAVPLPAAGVLSATRPAGVLATHGRPITYGYLHGRFGLDAYQTVYARRSPDGSMGSAEMPSAGRPLTTEAVTRLVASGVAVAPVVLHCGVSSPEAGEPPAPERFDVPAATARLVNLTHATGGRVVAVGTTVVRALESAVDDDGGSGPGLVTARRGWTDLVLGPGRPARVTDGLVSGLHEPEASHLQLLQAVAGDLVGPAYAAAVAERYLWHEFGDSMLLLT